jgi:hypothetical protein
VIWLMLRARRGQAFALALLALLTVASAYAMGSFAAAADRRAVRAEVARATPDELRVDSVSSYLMPAVDQFAPDPVFTPVEPTEDFGRTVPGVLRAAGLVTVLTVSTNVTVGAPGHQATFPRLTFREDQCAHLVVEAGRCPLSNGDIVLTSSYAKRLGLKIGSVTTVTWVAQAKPSDDVAYVSGPFGPLTVTVVGFVHPRDDDEPFWGADGFSSPDGRRETDSAVLTTRGTFRLLRAGDQVQTVDGLLPVAQLTPAGLTELVAAAAVAVKRSQETGAITTTRVNVLAARVDADRASARVVIGSVGLPLLAVGWLVINLAVGYALAGRRAEVGLVSMRGATRMRRWWLGAGEPVVAVAVGAAAGIGVGAAAGWVVTRHVFGPAGAVVGTGFGYVAAAFAGALLAAVVAVWRPMRAPAVELLRDVPARADRWRSYAFDAIVVAVAVVAALQLRASDDRPAGVALVAPVLAIVAAALVLARLLTPIAAHLGARRLRGRRGAVRMLGARLGALQLARRPGVARLFALIVTVSGLVAFAAADINVATGATAARAKVEAGAGRVLSVGPTTRLALLRAVRAADPAGRWAMAVAAIPQPSPAAAPILAVDAPRLAAVAAWPESSVSAAQAQALLDPGTHTGIQFSAARISLDLTMPNIAPFDDPIDGRPTVPPNPMLTLALQPLSDAAAEKVTAKTRSGRVTYEFDTPFCAGGCQLASIDLDSPLLAQQLHYTLHELRSVAPAAASITKFDGPFRVPDTEGSDFAATMTPQPDGLGITAQRNSQGGLTTIVAPADAPYPIPVLSTQPLITRYQGVVAGRQVPMKSLALPAALPRLGRLGILVDLGTIDRSWDPNGELATYPEVWLGPAAPADAVDKLTAAGLAIVGERTYRASAAYYEGQGPASGRRFFPYAMVALVGFAVAAVALAAAVDRRRRARELRALRDQGLRAGRAASAAYLGQLVPAVLAVLVGPLVGVAAWTLWRSRSPIFTDGASGVAVAAWPGTYSVLRWAVLLALPIVAVALVVAEDLRRTVRR